MFSALIPSLRNIYSIVPTIAFDHPMFFHEQEKHAFDKILKWWYVESNW